MKISELIKALSNFPQDLEVIFSSEIHEFGGKGDLGFIVTEDGYCWICDEVTPHREILAASTPG